MVYLKLAQVAKKYCVARDRVYQWRDMGCPYMQLTKRGKNLFPEDELDAWLRVQFWRDKVEE